MAYAFLSYGSLFILSLILRKVFLKYLNVDYLGIEGVLGNIFSLMALVDVGTGALITYLLYKAFSDEDKKEVAILMGMYRNMYLLIAAVMAVLSIFLIPLLPFLITSEVIEWHLVLSIYCIKMLGMTATYCYSYRRLLFKVDQCEYVCTKVDMVSSYLKYFVWFAVLLAWHSYIIYLIVEVLAVLGANIYIAYLSKKRYPYASGAKVALKEYRERHFFKDMKNTYVLKIAGTIFGSVDNLIISTFLGLRSVAILSNYLLITYTLSQGFAKLLMPLQGSIGNYVYAEDREKSIRLFRMFDTFAFMIGSIITCCFISVVNNFIIIWIGEEFVLSNATVLTISLYLYVGFCSHFTCCFRDVFGRFELDRNFAIIGAIINLSLSLLLVKSLGILGVYIGTVVGLMGFWIGRYHVLKNELFKQPIGYWEMQAKFFVIFVMTVSISMSICSLIDNTLKGLFLKTLISLAVTMMVDWISLGHSCEVSMIKEYVGHGFKIFKTRI